MERTKGVLTCWTIFVTALYLGDDKRCVFHLRKFIELQTYVHFTSVTNWKTYKMQSVNNNKDILEEGGNTDYQIWRLIADIE